MKIRFVEDIYSDFLFDCYIANQHLTEEDWLYYGREEHHTEIPNRDGGLLTPLNSQTLTTYQHWIAGVLQSEMLGKCCFACIPPGVLPSMFEQLRIKWASKLAQHQVGSLWWNDGKTETRTHKCPGLGWRKGRLPDKLNKGNVWWNNGLAQTRSYTSPGEDWIQGRLDYQFRKTYWWNNGAVNKRSQLCPGPEWKRGQLTYRSKNK